MAQFNVHEAKTNFSQLLELVERGEEVIVARHGKPVARLIPFPEKKSILGLGVGDPNYRFGLSDEEAFSPMSAEEAAAFFEGRR
jgi:prevent-host-death family protein